MEELFVCGDDLNKNLCVEPENRNKHKSGQVSSFSKVLFPYSEYKIEEVICTTSYNCLIWARDRRSGERVLLASGQEICGSSEYPPHTFYALDLSPVRASSVKRVLGCNKMVILVLDDGTMWKGSPSGFQQVKELNCTKVSMLANGYYLVIIYDDSKVALHCVVFGFVFETVTVTELEIPANSTVVNLYAGSYQFLVETRTNSGEQRFYYRSDVTHYMEVNTMPVKRKQLQMLAPSMYNNKQVKSVLIDWNIVIFVAHDGTMYIADSKQAVLKLSLDNAPTHEIPSILTCFNGMIYLVYKKSGEIWGKGSNAQAQLGLGHCNPVSHFTKILDEKEKPLSKFPLKSVSTNYESLILWFRVEETLFTRQRRLIPATAQKTALGDLTLQYYS